MHSRARLGAAAWFVLLTVLVAGCGDDSDDESAPTTGNTRFPPPRQVENKQIKEGEDACGLVSRAEVESVAGIAVNPGDGVTTKGGTSSCAYRVRDNTAQYVGVIVQPQGAGTFDNASKQLAGSTESISGLGERAFLARDTVYALKGDRLLILTVSTAQPDPVRREAAIRLSQAAIGKV